MMLSSASVVFGVGVSLNNEPLSTKSAGKLVFPVMVSTKPIESNEELVC